MTMENNRKIPENPKIWEPILANESGTTTEFGHVFVTKSVRFGRTELSLRLSECSRRDLAIEKGFRACFLKNKRKIELFYMIWR